MSRTARSGMVFALLLVFFDMLSATTVVPVLPPLILTMLHGDKAAAARTIGILGTVFSGMQFLFGPVQGALSDRFGRRPIMIVSCLGLAGGQVIAATAPDWHVLLLGRVLAGIAAANISTATAYLADILPPEQRAAGFGRIGIAFGAGLVMGPVVGGLLGGIGLRLPFWSAAIVSLANAGWAILVMTESLPLERRTRFRLARANPLGALGFLRSDARLARIASAMSLSLLAQQALISVFILSATIRFGWAPRQLGAAMAMVGLCYAVVGGGLVQPAMRRFGEPLTLGVGFGFGIAGFAILAAAPDGLVYLIAIPVVSLWGLAGPVMQGAMSRSVGPEAQGLLQGAITSLGGLTGVVGPLLFGGTLAFALRAHEPPGLPFVIAAVLLAISAPLAVRALR